MNGSSGPVSKRYQMGTVRERRAVTHKSSGRCKVFFVSSVFGKSPVISVRLLAHNCWKLCHRDSGYVGPPEARPARAKFPESFVYFCPLTVCIPFGARARSCYPPCGRYHTRVIQPFQCHSACRAPEDEVPCRPLARASVQNEISENQFLVDVLSRPVRERKCVG